MASGEVVAQKEERELRVKKRGPGKELEALKEPRIEDFDGERILTVSFFPDALSAPRWKRAKKAARILREKIKKYVKNVTKKGSDKKIRVREPVVWISPKLNELIWSRGARNPPRRVRVRVLYKVIDEEEGRVELRAYPFE